MTETGDASIPPGGHQGDAAAAASLLDTICAGTAADMSVLYLYDCDRVGHRDGFGPQVRTYRDAIRIMMRERVQPLLDAVAARAGDEEWLVLLTTDHGGTVRSIDAARLHPALPAPA